jgi:hypothetical protein
MKKFLLVSLLSVSVASFAAHTNERTVFNTVCHYVIDNPVKVLAGTAIAYDIYKHGFSDSMVASVVNCVSNNVKQLVGNASLLAQDTKSAAKCVQTTGSYVMARITR